MKSYFSLIIVILALFSQDYYPFSSRYLVHAGSTITYSEGKYEGYKNVENKTNIAFDIAFGYSLALFGPINIETQVDLSVFNPDFSTNATLENHSFKPKYGMDFGVHYVWNENLILIAGYRFGYGTLILDDKKGILSEKEIETSFVAPQIGVRYQMYGSYTTIKLTFPDMKETYKSIAIRSKDVHIQIYFALPF